MIKKLTGKKVVVTTQYRGVFFGEIVENNAPSSIVLKDARNCLYWDSSLHGFIGLAASGPNKGCRIGPAASLPMEIFDITSIVECTPQAVENWERGAWA